MARDDGDPANSANTRRRPSTRQPSIRYSTARAHSANARRAAPRVGSRTSDWSMAESGIKVFSRSARATRLRSTSSRNSGLEDAPAGLGVPGKPLPEPDRRAVGAQAHRQRAQVLAVQGVAPGVAAREQPRREQHNLVEGADPHGAGGLDLLPGEAGELLEILRGRGDLDAHLRRRALAEPPRRRFVARLERLERRFREHPVALGIEAQDEVLALDRGQGRGLGSGADTGGTGRNQKRRQRQQPEHTANIHSAILW